MLSTLNLFLGRFIPKSFNVTGYLIFKRNKKVLINEYKEKVHNKTMNNILQYLKQKKIHRNIYNNAHMLTPLIIQKTCVPCHKIKAQTRNTKYDELLNDDKNSVLLNS